MAHFFEFTPQIVQPLKMVRPARVFSSPSSLSSRSLSSSNNNSTNRNLNKNVNNIDNNIRSAEKRIESKNTYNQASVSEVHHHQNSEKANEKDRGAKTNEIIRAINNCTNDDSFKEINNRDTPLSSKVAGGNRNNNCLNFTKVSKSGVIVPVRSHSGPLEPVDNHSYVAGSTELSSKPSVIWYRSQYQMSQMADTKHVINAVCSNYLFARVKFVNKKKDLVFSKDPNSICYHVISQCHLAPFVNQQEWWLENCKHVMTTLTSLRSNRASTLRQAFFGKKLMFLV